MSKFGEINTLSHRFTSAIMLSTPSNSIYVGDERKVKHSQEWRIFLLFEKRRRTTYQVWQRPQMQKTEHVWGESELCYSDKNEANTNSLNVGDDLGKIKSLMEGKIGTSNVSHFESNKTTKPQCLRDIVLATG